MIKLIHEREKFGTYILYIKDIIFQTKHKQ